MQSEQSIQPISAGPDRRAIGAGRRLSIRPTARAVALVGAPSLLIGVLAWPMIFTNQGFNPDWPTHLWYMWSQSLAIRDNFHPSLFLNYSHSVFYPEYAFYGGTLYAMVGVLSLALGEAPIEAYILAYILGFVGAYGGWYWLGRMAGLGRWWAQVPGVIFITSAYYLTLLYARGDLPEFTGVSMIPLIIASGLSVLRADRLRLGPALALAVSGIAFFGSHNLTLVWGSTVIALTCLLAAIGIPQARRWVTMRGVLRVAGLLVPAFLVSAWFLLPAIAYQANTQIGSRYLYWRLLLGASMYMVSATHLFTISRAPATVPQSDFALSLPILAMAWSLVSLVLYLCKGLRGPWARLLLLCAGMTTLMTIVLTRDGIVLALPRPYAILQFIYRLESYVILGVCGAVLAGLALARRDTSRVRVWAWVLVPVLLVAVVGAIQQTDAHPDYGGRQQAVTSRGKPGLGEEGLMDYTDAKLPLLVSRGGRPPEVSFPAASIKDERISRVVHLSPGQLVYTNIAGGPELVHVTGAKIVGLSPEGNDVLQIGPSIAGRSEHGSARNGGPPWTEVVSLSPATGLPIVLGRILALAALAFLVGEFLVLGFRHRSRRASMRADAAR